VTPSQSSVAPGPLVSPTQTSGTAGPGSFFGTDSLSSSGDTQAVLAASLSGSQQQSPTTAPVSPHLQQNGFTNSGTLCFSKNRFLSSWCLLSVPVFFSCTANKKSVRIIINVICR
jgi:hypothetical protein